MDFGGDFSDAQIADYERQLKLPNDSKRGMMYGVLCSLQVISTLTLIFRLYARKWARVKVGWDDAMTIAAWTFTTALTSIAIASVPYTKHLIFLTGPEIEWELRAIYACQYLYAFANACYKVAILHYYLRIFSTPKARLVIRSFLAFIWLASFATIITIPFQCRPIQASWQLRTPGVCINLAAFFISSAIICIVGDVIILSIPIPIVWRLQLTVAKRLSVIGIFLLGSFVLVSSVMRLVYIQGIIIGSKSFDPVWTFNTTGLWNPTELTFGIVCASLPTIWPLLAHAKQRLHSMATRASSLNNTSRSAPSKDSRNGTGSSQSQTALKTAHYTLTPDILVDDDAGLRIEGVYMTPLAASPCHHSASATFVRQLPPSYSREGWR